MEIVRILLIWIAAFGVVWAVEQTQFARNLWSKFVEATDDRKFFKALNPEMRLAGVGFGISFIGALLGFAGFGAPYFAPLAIPGIAGFFITALGVFLGIYSIIAFQLGVFGLRRFPVKKQSLNLTILENESGEGVVSFEPWAGQGPEYVKDNSRFYCHLTVRGERVFEFGCPCGTCGIVFRKIKSAENRISDAEAVKLLEGLNAMPTHDVLLRLARILEPGPYHPVISEGAVRRTEPGSKEDFFANDVVRLFGLEPPEYKEPSSPKTAYYRFGSNRAIDRTGRTRGPHKALISAVVMPLQDLSRLNQERVSYWKEQYSMGKVLTALAVSVIDDQAPALSPRDGTCDYEEQMLFALCLLDGHHRIQAAAELGAPVRILSFLTKKFSLLKNDSDIAAVLSGYTPQLRK